MITDRIPVSKKRRAVEKAFKSYIRGNLANRPFTVLHHASASHICLQAADYCNWAVYKKWNDGERRPYDVVRQFIKSEFDIVSHGREYFY